MTMAGHALKEQGVTREALIASDRDIRGELVKELLPRSWEGGEPTP